MRKNRSDSVEWASYRVCGDVLAIMAAIAVDGETDRAPTRRSSPRNEIEKHSVT